MVMIFQLLIPEKNVIYISLQNCFSQNTLTKYFCVTCYWSLANTDIKKIKCCVEQVIYPRYFVDNEIQIYLEKLLPEKIQRLNIAVPATVIRKLLASLRC